MKNKNYLFERFSRRKNENTFEFIEKTLFQMQKNKITLYFADRE